MPCRLASLVLCALVALSALLGPTPARLLCQMSGEEQPVVKACCRPAPVTQESLDAPGCCTILPGEERAAPDATVSSEPSAPALTTPALHVPLPALAPLVSAATPLAPSAPRGPPRLTRSPRAPPT